MKVLGIDPGTHCGYALLDNGRRVVSGTWRLKRTKERDGMRYLRMSQHVEDMITDYHPDVVAYELVRRHAGTRAAHVYGGIVAALMMPCERHGVPYEGHEVGTIKKAATGNGRADKAMMIEAARGVFDHDPIDDNEADALMIAYLVSDTV